MSTPTASQEIAANIAAMKAEIAALKAENEQAKASIKAAQRKITFKVGEKGGVSVYGLGRFPVTLFKSQWERLLDAELVASLKAFIVANNSILSQGK